MDAKFKLLPLDLQFFAEGDPVDNPPQPKDQNPTDDGKRFTQEDLNRINIKGKNDELKRILKATGFETEEALIAHLTKVKDYDEKSKKVAEYEAKAIKDTYLAEIRKNNVADEYIDTVYVAVAPTENEKVEDYNKRVATYMESHKALMKVSQSDKYFDSNYGYRGIQHQDSEPLSLNGAIKEKMGRK